MPPGHRRSASYCHPRNRKESDSFDDFDGEFIDDDFGEDDYSEDHEEFDVEESVNDELAPDGDSNEEEPEGDGFDSENAFFAGSLLGFAYEAGRRKRRKARANSSNNHSIVGFWNSVYIGWSGGSFYRHLLQHGRPFRGSLEMRLKIPVGFSGYFLLPLLLLLSLFLRLRFSSFSLSLPLTSLMPVFSLYQQLLPPIAAQKYGLMV